MSASVHTFMSSLEFIGLLPASLGRLTACGTSRDLERDADLQGEEHLRMVPIADGEAVW